MTDDELLGVLEEAAAAVTVALRSVADFGFTGRRDGQYHLDVAADAAAVEVLVGAGLGVVSEESGDHHPERELWVSLDPLDGSTNAARSFPWFATSACVVDGGGPRVALVVNQATGERYDAVRGGGARRNGQPVAPSGCRRLDEAVIAVVGYPARHLGWWQLRAMGAAALDLCALAAGQVDAFADCSRHGHAPWDYLAASLVCREAGVEVVDAGGRDLVARSAGTRRWPLAAATGQLFDELRAALGAAEAAGA